MSIVYHNSSWEVPQRERLNHTISNWNPDTNYGDVYAAVDFCIRVPSFTSKPDHAWTKAEQEAFYGDIHRILTSIGWEKSDDQALSTYQKGKAHLLILPTVITGVVRKNEVKQIAENLCRNNTFVLAYVDIVANFYDVSDEEYLRYLASNKDYMRREVLRMCSARKKTAFFSVQYVAAAIGQKIRLNRVAPQASSFQQDLFPCNYVAGTIIPELVREGLLATARSKEGEILVKTISKTERKSFGIHAAF